MKYTTTQNRTKQALKRTDDESNLLPIATSPRIAFRLLGISRDLGYRWIKQGIIPTIRPGGRRMLVLVRELERMLVAMFQANQTCRTCAKKDPKGRCAAFSTPPKDVKNCPAWSLDADWNLKLWRDTANYGKKGE